jgi:hypothetical protein
MMTPMAVPATKRAVLVLLIFGNIVGISSAISGLKNAL